MKNKTVPLTVSGAVLLLALLILELLPSGAVLNFMGDPATSETFRSTYSYFSLTPFGLANFGPLITAILTCVIAFLFILTLFVKRKGTLKTAMITLSTIALPISLSPLLYGIRFFSVIGGAISFLLMVLTVVLILLRQMEMPKPIIDI